MRNGGGVGVSGVSAGKVFAKGLRVWIPSSHAKEPSELLGTCNLSGRVRRQELTDGRASLTWQAPG